MKRTAIFSIILLASLSGFAQKQDPAKKSMFPVLKDGSPSAYTVFTQPKLTKGLAMMNPAGVTYDTKTFLGRRGALPAKSSKENYFYFQTATDQLVMATGTFFVTVTYLDKGQGAMALEYMYSDNNGKKQVRNEQVFLGNSGIWQQHSFTMAGATLDHSFVGDTDFRIMCPGILIHAVMLTRFPAAKAQHATSTLFRQSSVSPPPGYDIGVFLTPSSSRDMWEKENVFAEKAQLYRAWGAQFVIDTVYTGRLQTPKGALDFSPYAERLSKLAEQDLTWTPRFEIGVLNSLPPSMTENIQRAVGTDRPKEGPMISLWEPRMDDAYSFVFEQMKRSISPQHVPKMILSFAGDWGPLYFSAGSQNQQGWPDFWAGGPLAQRSFVDYLQRRYGNINSVRALWGERVSSWNEIVPVISPDYLPRRILDTYEWYRESLTTLIRNVLAKAKIFYPQTTFVIEIAEDFEFSAADPTAIVSLAAETGSELIMIPKSPLAAASPIWGNFASACQRRNVKFGLRSIGQGGGEEMLSSLYSLASDGGSLFHFSEGFLVGNESWSSYAASISLLSNNRSNPRIALIFPRTSMTVESPLLFMRLAGELRESFGFDVIDESELASLSVSEYPLIFVPWGTIWTEDALSNFQRLARSGAALVVHAEQPWRNVRGDVDFNEELFAVQLERGADGWRMLPRGDKTQPYGGSANPITRVERRSVEIGTAVDDPFLGGQWGKPENELTARQYGFPFKSFRWMGERGNINLPMLPGKEYLVQLEGFIPAGKRVQVYINKEYLGGIVGQGEFRYSQPVTGKLRSRKGDVNVLLRGQLWNMGEIFAATQTQRVSLALSKVSVVPVGEKPGQKPIENIAPNSPEFQREALRGSWMREVGQGITLIAPGEYVNEWVFRQMLYSITRQPSILDARFRFALPPDAARNDVYTQPLGGSRAVYLNLNKREIPVGGWDRYHRERIIPPMSVYYSN